MNFADISGRFLQGHAKLLFSKNDQKSNYVLTILIIWPILIKIYGFRIDLFFLPLWDYLVDCNLSK